MPVYDLYLYIVQLHLTLLIHNLIFFLELESSFTEIMKKIFHLLSVHHIIRNRRQILEKS